MPMAAAPTVVKRLKRPNTAAAMACTRKPIGSAWPMGSPTTPARRYIARKASTEATAHTTVCRRFTGIPSDAARSGRSADPMMAMPIVERCRNRASPASAIGTMMMVRMSWA